MEIYREFFQVLRYTSRDELVLNSDFVATYIGNFKPGMTLTIKVNEYDSYHVQLAAGLEGLIFGQGWEDVSRVCCFYFASLLIFTYLGDGILELKLFDPAGTQVLIPPQQDLMDNRLMQNLQQTALTSAALQCQSNIQTEGVITFEVKSESSRVVSI
ncbi:hypothetical protein QVD17_41581 [Tagetes erecta]|uniref:Uncharacterized protein n=1 Tax=Tagetes erecta TaxID=13708 RepID=A0AAD8JMY7_TARER|nr:hypothetical protein QVD17_41581 [Tagetes erecta]